eukprot:scaffold5771_cov171-Amphora_coffeaeformis.AAC.25
MNGKGKERAGKVLRTCLMLLGKSRSIIVLGDIALGSFRSIESGGKCTKGTRSRALHARLSNRGKSVEIYRESSKSLAHSPT